MQQLSPSVTGDEIKTKIAELESRLATAAAETGDIDIRATATADGLAMQHWGCEIIILGDERIERRPSPSASLRLAGDAFEQCGSLLLGVPPDCLPACLAKPLAEHAHDPAAAWIAAVRRMHERYPEHGLGIEQASDAVFLFPAVAKSVAVLAAIRQHLRQPAAATPEPATAVAAAAAADLNMPARSTAEVVELLKQAEELVRHDSSEKARSERLSDVEAAAEAAEAAADFRGLGYKRMHERLEALSLLRPAEARGAAKAEAFAKKIQEAIRKLAWRQQDADHARLARRTVDGGQAAELLGKGASVKRKRSGRQGEARECCRNCGIFDAEGHADDSVLRHFCITCSGRHPHSRLDAILKGEQEPDCESLPARELLRHRQAVRSRPR